MVVNADGVPVTAVPPGVVRQRPARGTRRKLLRGLLGAGAALVLAPVVAASQSPGPQDGSADTPPGSFEETYRGRRLRGVLTPADRAPGDGPRWEVTVDGRPLHLMRRADGTWLSTVDHYCSYATPLEAARAAVDELGPGEQLRATGAPRDHPHHGSDGTRGADGKRGADRTDGSHMGGHHGLHA
ncbi:tyrosinase cofactor [Streptomyces soliscabiei]|uniref:tyrosinase cofactor n=1 Tax=Streptomyces soliscabiei TaxID=588897 RepID=UPI0029BDED46|nr:tyrosinase cofactor [Streptomyces sp. NY05-11A]MDX2679562.1 tyrosinase cofactor [Streptomyces sp. NY05-11A]